MNKNPYTTRAQFNEKLYAQQVYTMGPFIMRGVRWIDAHIGAHETIYAPQYMCWNMRL